MFHLFLDICCKRFDLDVVYVFTHILQQYVPKCFIVVSVFCCSKCFHVASCKCVYLRVAYVFTHMMQVFYLDVVYVYNGFKCFCKSFRCMFQMFNLFSNVCCNCLSGCLKTSSSVESPFLPFCCLASVSGVGRRRRSPLARVGPMCLSVGAAGRDVGGQA